MQEIEIDARGMCFSGLADGPEDHPLLLLLHGLPRNSWEWHHQIPPIEAERFAATQPGHREQRDERLGAAGNLTPSPG